MGGPPRSGGADAGLAGTSLRGNAGVEEPCSRRCRHNPGQGRVHRDPARIAAWPSHERPRGGYDAGWSGTLPIIAKPRSSGIPSSAASAACSTSLSELSKCTRPSPS